jgi:hypothetical protein
MSGGSFLQPLATSSLLGPNILLSIIFQNALNPIPYIDVRDIVSHTYQKRSKITVTCILISKNLVGKGEDEKFWA